MSLSRRQFLTTSSAWAACTLMAAEGTAASASPRRRNLLFVFSDQQSSDMLGCYGNPAMVTPHVDQFATEALQFQHCIASSPLCTPFRGMLLSGRHPLHNGAVYNDWQMIPDSNPTFARSLRDAGYHTGYIGKWHLLGGNRNRPVPAGPLRYGFDDDFLTNNCTVEFRAHHAWFWDHEGRKQFYPRWEPDAQTDQAIAFLEARATSPDPWALFLSWHPPHNWNLPGSPYPPGWCYHLPEDALGAEIDQKPGLRPLSPRNAQQEQIYRGYQALCTNLDVNFGRLLAALKRLNLDQNTVVVFTSDHGDCLRSRGRHDMHKRRPEADSCRVPFLFRAPGLAPGTRHIPIGTLDLMPTLLASLNTPVPTPLHGRNLWKEIVTGDDQAQDSVPLFMSCPQGVDWRGIYTPRYTYSFGPDGRRFNCLYDREADPHEEHNLFADPEYRALRAALHEASLTWMHRFGDRFVRHEDLAAASLQTPGAFKRLHNTASGALRGAPVDMAATAIGWVAPN